MHREVVEGMGQLLPPVLKQEMNSSSSLAVNMRTSEVYLLCEDGTVRSLSLKGGRGKDSQDEEEAGRARELRMEGVESLLDMGFSGVEFNFSGTILVLSGARSVAVAFLPRLSHDSAADEDGEGVECKFMMLYQASLAKNEVVKVMWHPLSDKHLMVLLKTNKLVMFDVVEGKESEYLLNASKTYISFCFGPGIEWMSLSVFLLDSEGNITCMCPLVPTGAVVPTSTLYELHEWLSDPLIERTNKSYLQRVDAYLRAAFGARPSEESGRLRRVGILNGKPLHNDHPLHEYFYQQPLLQGPLVVEGRMKKRSRSQASAAVPCDICVPSLTGDREPVAVFVVTWSDGVIEQLVMEDAFGPAWEKDDNSFNNEVLCFGKPSLVHVETLCIHATDGSSPNDFYKVQSDPINPAHFHITTRRAGESYLLHLGWIESTISSSEPTRGDLNLPESRAHLIFKHPVQESGISGQVFISDPLFGHVTILRGIDGYTTAVNLRVEEKLMKLDSQIRIKDELLNSAQTQETSTVASISRSTDSILTNVSAALKKIPMANYSDDEASASKFGESLKQCILYLGKEVMDPLEEFEVGMKFAKESLQERYDYQYACLHGATEAPPQESTSSASLTIGSKSNKSNMGLLQKYEAAKKRHEELKQDLDKVGKKISRQKDVAASSLHFSRRARIGLTRAEELYNVQLDRWYTVYQHLEVAMERLKEQLDTMGTSADLTSPPTSKKTTSIRKSKTFMTPTKPRSSLSHISSPHRITYRNSPVSGKPCRVMSTSDSASASTTTTPKIVLQGNEKEWCQQLQKETGVLHDEVRKEIKLLEERLSKLSTVL